MKACMRKEAWCIPLVCLWTCNSASNYLPYKLFVSLLHESNIAIVAITFEKESNHKQRHPNESRFHNYLVHEISMLISALFNFSMMKQCSSKPYHRLSERTRTRQTNGRTDKKKLGNTNVTIASHFYLLFYKNMSNHKRKLLPFNDSKNSPRFFPESMDVILPIIYHRMDVGHGSLWEEMWL